MTADSDWGDVLARGAEIARQAEAAGGGAEAVPRVLAAALAWALLVRYWSGQPREIIQRWREDVPEALAEIATRSGIVPRR